MAAQKDMWASEAGRI